MRLYQKNRLIIGPIFKPSVFRGMHRPQYEFYELQYCQRRRSSRRHSHSRSPRNYRHRSASRQPKEFLAVLPNPPRHRRRSVSRKTDLLFTNGNVFAVKLDPPQHTEMIKMEKRNVPLRRDVPPEVYVSSPLPKVLYARKSKPNHSTINLYKGTVGLSRTNSLTSLDTFSNLSCDSNLTSREEAVARKLNNLILKMEADLPHTNGPEGQMSGLVWNTCSG